MRQILFLIWTCFSVGYSATISGDGTEILGSVYQIRNEQTYNGKAPKEIMIKSINETIIFIGKDSYSIQNFGPMKRSKVKRIAKMALIDTKGNTVHNQGSHTLFNHHKTKDDHMVFTAENDNIYQIALDNIKSRIFIISRPHEEPYGNLFVFDSTNPVIDSNNRVVTELLSEFGDHVSAIAIDPIVGNIIYSQILEKSKWNLQLLAPYHDTVIESSKLQQNNRQGRLESTFKTTTPNPIIIDPIPNIIDPQPNIIDQEPNIIDPKPNIIHPKPNIIDPKPIIINSKNNSKFDVIVFGNNIPNPKKVTMTSEKYRHTCEQTRSGVESVLKEFKKNLVSLYIQGSGEQMKSVVIENKRLRSHYSVLIDKHEYILKSANVIFTPVAPFTEASTVNTDTYEEKLTDSVVKLENDLMKLIDESCVV